MECANPKPWNGIGVDVETHLSPSEILYKLKIDRDFGSHPIPSGMPKNFANQETFRFFNSFVEVVDLRIETVGSMDGGRILWALAPLKKDFTLQGEDRLEGYLLLASRNENRMSIEIQFITVRVACNNTIRVNYKGKDSFKNIYRREFIREFPFMTPIVRNFDDLLIEKVKRTVNQGREAIRSFALAAERLTHKRVEDLTAHRYLLRVFQPETESTNMRSQEIEKLAEKKTKKAIEAVRKAPGQNLNTAQMTAWGLLNAVTYTVDHHLGNSPDSRLRQAWFGPLAKIKKRAFELALAL